MPSESLPDRTTESAVFCFVLCCWLAKSTIFGAIRRNQAVPWLDLVLQPPDQATLVIQPDACDCGPIASHEHRLGAAHVQVSLNRKGHENSRRKSCEFIDRTILHRISVPTSPGPCPSGRRPWEHQGKGKGKKKRSRLDHKRGLI